MMGLPELRQAVAEHAGASRDRVDWQTEVAGRLGRDGGRWRLLFG
jgi:hypothetical protein